MAEFARIGRIKARSPEAGLKRGEMQRKQLLAQSAWDRMEHPDEITKEQYLNDVYVLVKSCRIWPSHVHWEDNQLHRDDSQRLRAPSAPLGRAGGISHSSCQNLRKIRSIYRDQESSS